MERPKLEKCEGASRALLVVPGITSSTDEKPLKNVIEAFGKCHVVRMDCWDGAKELDQLTLGDLHDLLDQADNLLEDKVDFDEKILLGKSFGAQLFLSYSGSLEADQMILLAPAVGTDGENIEKWENTELSEASRVTDISISEDSVDSLTTDTLIFHGAEDEIIPMENSEKISEMMLRCDLCIIEGADHSFSGFDEELIEELEQKINQFKK